MEDRFCTYVRARTRTQTRGTSSSSCRGRDGTYARSCFRAPRRNISLAVGPLEGMQGDRERVRRNTLMNRPRRRYRRSTDTMAATVVARISGDRRREKRKSIGRQVRRARLQGLDDLSPRAVRPLIGGGEKRPLDGQFDEASFTIDTITVPIPSHYR